MTIDEAIQKRGFRRWYERQLIEGHVYLAAGLLALFGTLLAVEVFDYRASIRDIATSLLAAIVGAAACLYAIRRFMRLMGRAEYRRETGELPAVQDVRTLPPGACVRRAERPRRPRAQGALPRVRERVDDRMRRASNVWPLDHPRGRGRFIRACQSRGFRAV